MTKQDNKDKQKKKGLGPVAIRHRKVLENLTKNVGKGRKSMVKAMIEEGYSESYAKSGHIKSVGNWKQLIDEILNDQLLAQTHYDLLTSTKVEYMMFAPDVPEEAIYEIIQEAGGIVKKIVHSVGAIHCYFFKADGRIKVDALKLAFQIRNKMSPEKIELDVKDKYRNMSNQELADKIKALRARFNKTD